MSKLQVPSSKETSSSKLQMRLLEIGIWSLFGTWNLELGAFHADVFPEPTAARRSRRHRGADHHSPAESAEVSQSRLGGDALCQSQRRAEPKAHASRRHDPAGVAMLAGDSARPGAR